jgi:multimeric flavodoxin WrbA
MWRDKVAAGFTNSGCMSGDKLHALQTMSIFAAQHGMHWVNLGLKPGWSLSTSTGNELNRLGVFLGAAAQCPADLGVEGMHESDVDTCRQLGMRVASVSAMLVAGERAINKTTETSSA